MDDHQNPTGERRAGGDPVWRSSDRASLYAARLASPEVIRAREARRRAEQYATRGIVPFGRRPVRRAARPRRTLIASVAALTSLVGGGGAALAAQAIYQVRSGDTLSELAEAHNSSVDELVGLNALADPDLIVTGDTLLLPAVDSAALNAVHLIVWGDTLSEIAHLHGTTIEQLMDFNDISDPDLIVVGDELLVPTTLDVPALPDVVVQDDEEGEDVDPGNMSDDVDDEHGSIDDPEGDDGDAVDGPSEESPAVEPIEIVDTGDGDTDDVTGDDDTIDEAPQPAPIEIEVAALHLVTDGETLESIAGLYSISVETLVAANGQAADGVAPGMILAIPEGATSGVQLVGVPVVVAGSAGSTDAAALASATGYWGGEIPLEETQAALADGAYEVDALSGILERYGYHPGVFDSSSGTETLTAQIDAGFPVIVWIDDVYGYRAVVVQGHDADGVLLLDALDGQSMWVGWDDFSIAWDAGGGAAIAVAPL